MTRHDPKKSLLDIIDAIERIDMYMTNVPKEVFFGSLEKQDAIIRQLGIIGEAANRLPLVIHDQIVIPWTDIIDMRNILIHDYEGVSLRVVWGTVKKDLPPLKIAIEQFLKKK